MEKNYQIIKVDSEDLLQKAFDIRREVFIVEQKVEEDEEFDEFEKNSHHFVALDNEGSPVGASRWRETSKGVKLERFVVKKELRGQGLGSDLVRATLDDIIDQKGHGVYLYLHAQLDAVPLYQKFDFQKKGEKFDECNIWHYYMFRES
jgi:predicted GNAT family N-acyltransferase